MIGFIQHKFSSIGFTEAPKKCWAGQVEDNREPNKGGCWEIIWVGLGAETPLSPKPFNSLTSLHLRITQSQPAVIFVL